MSNNSFNARPPRHGHNITTQAVPAHPATRGRPPAAPHTASQPPAQPPQPTTGAPAPPSQRPAHARHQQPQPQRHTRPPSPAPPPRTSHQPQQHQESLAAHQRVIARRPGWSRGYSGTVTRCFVDGSCLVDLDVLPDTRSFAAGTVVRDPAPPSSSAAAAARASALSAAFALEQAKCSRATALAVSADLSSGTQPVSLHGQAAVPAPPPGVTPPTAESRAAVRSALSRARAALRVRYEAQCEDPHRELSDEQVLEQLTIAYSKPNDSGLRQRAHTSQVLSRRFAAPWQRRVVDWFGGVGTWFMGKNVRDPRLGWHSAAVIDTCTDKTDVYKQNQPQARVINHDANDTAAITPILDELGRCGAWLVSSPCVDFTRMNDYRTPGESTPTTRLICAAPRAVLRAKFKPTAVVFENVKGMAATSGPRGHPAHPDWIKAQGLMARAGYTMHKQLINAKYIGTPTDRERLIAIFTLGGTTCDLSDTYTAVRTDRAAVMSDLRHFRRRARRYAAYFVYQRYNAAQSKPWDTTHECMRRNSHCGYAAACRKPRRPPSKDCHGRIKPGDAADMSDTLELDVQDFRELARVHPSTHLPLGRKAAVGAIADGLIPAMASLALASISFAGAWRFPSGRTWRSQVQKHVTWGTPRTISDNFDTHQRVWAQLGDWTGWYEGIVAASHADGTFRIAFEDGEVHDHCSPARMRRAGPASAIQPRKPASSSVRPASAARRQPSAPGSHVATAQAKRSAAFLRGLDARQQARSALQRRQSSLPAAASAHHVSAAPAATPTAALEFDATSSAHHAVAQRSQDDSTTRGTPHAAASRSPTPAQRKPGSRSTSCTSPAAARSRTPAQRTPGSRVTGGTTPVAATPPRTTAPHAAPPPADSAQQQVIDGKSLVGTTGWVDKITSSVLIGPGTADPLVPPGLSESQARTHMRHLQQLQHAGKLRFAAQAAASIREKEVERERHRLLASWHPPQALPTEFMLQQSAHSSAPAAAATHIMKVLRTQYKNLAHQFQGEWRGDGTLANLHRQRWWRLADPRLPPLASDTAGMASWDPGRNDTIDDSLPTIACPVSRSVHTFMDNHVAACSVCTAHELEHGRANSPGQMCASCPDNIGLVAHRLRTGYSPHFEYSPALVQEDNRGSCGKFFASTCAAMDKMDGIEGHFAPERREDQPPNTVGLLTVVRDKHMRAARAAGWPTDPAAKPPKGRVVTDYTAPGTNAALTRWPFRLDGGDEAVKLMKPKCWMVCLDLRSYFNKLPWTEEFSQRFGWLRDPRCDAGKWRFPGTPPAHGWPHPDAHKPPYRRMATCSFGLASIPAWSSMVSGQLAKILRSKGLHSITFYVDDFLIVCDTYEEALAQSKLFVSLMREMGFDVADDKTLPPSQRCVFLGLLLDSLAMEVSVTEDRAAAITETIDSLVAAGRGQKKVLHTLQGKLGYISQVVRGGKIYTRSLIRAVSAHRGRRGSTMIDVDGELLDDLRWWRRRLADLRQAGSRLWLQEADYTVVTGKSDASGRLGWGLVWGSDLFFSKWTAAEAMDPDMCYKELVPVLFLAETLGHQLAGKIVRVGIDNSGAVFDLLKGDSDTLATRLLLKRLADAQAKHNFDIIGVQCDRQQQTLADMLTRFQELHEVDACLPAGWALERPEGLPERCQWRLSPDSNSVLRLGARRR